MDPAGGSAARDGVPYTWTVDTWDGVGTTRASWVGHFKVDSRIGDNGPAPTDQAGPVTVNLANGNATVSTASPSFPAVGGNAGLSFTYNSQQVGPGGQPEDLRGLTASYYADTDQNGDFDPTAPVMAAAANRPSTRTGNPVARCPGCCRPTTTTCAGPGT